MYINNNNPASPKLLNKAFTVSISDLVGEKKVLFSSVYTMIK